MTQAISLKVTGMKCGGCEANVVNKLSAVGGVIHVQASSKDNQVDIEFDAAKISPLEMANLISGLGFEVQSP